MDEISWFKNKGPKRNLERMDLGRILRKFSDSVLGWVRLYWFHRRAPDGEPGYLSLEIQSLPDNGQHMLLREEEKCFAKSPRFTNQKRAFLFSEFRTFGKILQK